MFVLIASVLNFSILESKLFTFTCPKIMPLSLIPSMLHYEIESKGGYLLTKMILYRFYCQYKKKKAWNGKFSHLLQSLHISLSIKTVLLHFLGALRSHLVQQKLLSFNVLLQTKHTSEVGPGFNIRKLALLLFSEAATRGVLLKRCS